MTGEAEVNRANGAGIDDADANMADAVRRIARWGLSIGGAALVTGLIASLAGWADASRVCLVGGLGIIVALPVVNVVAALVEEIRRREWVFLAVAIAVLVVLIYNVGRAL
jgi:uncharacterized membrane protein